MRGEAFRRHGFRALVGEQSAQKVVGVLKGRPPWGNGLRAALVLLLASLPPGFGCPSSLAGHPLFPHPVGATGHHPYSIVAADLDRDGSVDLVTTSAQDGVSLLFGNGDGTFAPELVLDTFEPYDVRVLDVNGDGFDDLVVACIFGVSVFLGNGTRTFASATYIDADVATVFSVYAADFDEDSHLDVILSVGRLLFGLGDGTFDTPQALSGSDGSPWGVADFNRDGHADFVARVFSGMAVRLGNGDGTFENQSAFAVGQSPHPPAVGDFNEDGWADLAVPNGGSEDVSILLGGPGGVFGPQTRYPVLYGPQRIALGDLNRDGHADLMVSTTLRAEISVLLSNGDGTFQPETRLTTMFLGGDVVTADFDRDGDVDLAVASYNSGSQTKAVSAAPGVVSILEGDGLGGLLDEVPGFVDVEGYPESVIVADLNGDGHVDAATTNAGTGDVTILLGDGAGGLAAGAVSPVGQTPRAIAVGDVDTSSEAEASLDLVTADEGSAQISVLLGVGDGTFGASLAVPVERNPAALVLADLVGDGALDIATANPDSDDVTVLLGSGAGSFTVAGQLPVGDQPSAIAAGDFDGDGKLDLVTANKASGDVSLLINNGDGTFQAESRYPAGVSPGAIVVGDINDDQRPDIVLGKDAGSFQIAILLAGPAGGFEAPTLVRVTDLVHDVHLGDFDGDGRVDIAVTHTMSTLVTILLRQADGTLQSGVYALWGSNGGLASGDLDNDGRLDLVVTGDRFTVLLNRQPPYIRFGPDSRTLTWPILLGVDAFNIYRGALADLRQDLDDDGLPDAGYGTCRNAFDPDTTDTTFVDDEDPAPGSGFFYLRARVKAGVETDLGTTGDGRPRVPGQPCSPGGS